MAMDELCYRVSEAGDLPDLLRLWEEAGWGSLSPQQWREWFVDGPEGPCLITVAVDPRGEVVGQEVFAPSRVSVAGREVRALRLSAPILKQDLRGESLRQNAHPVFGLYKAAAAAATERGFEIVYSLPQYAWLKILRLIPRLGLPGFDEAAFGCAELPLEAAALAGLEPAARKVEARPVARFGPEYEELWRSARESFPIACGVVRDAAWLTFRNSGLIALEVRDREDGSLAGYSATRQTGLLADLLARRPEELTAVIAATALWLAAERRRGELGGVTHLKAMRTPALEPALSALRFTPVDYRFAFTCSILGSSVGRERIAPGRWYVMPGD
jgi:hypothetical protein